MMNKFKIFTTISLLLTTIRIFACGYSETHSVDNMIYRLVDDVYPFFNSYDDQPILYNNFKDEKIENLKLWRKQTKTTISNDSLEWFVYKSSDMELKKSKKDAVNIFGEDGYKLLCIAKECEKFRDHINSPWYYPKKDDPIVQNIERQVNEVKRYRGRYASRYALQTVRIMVSLIQYEEAIDYWETYGKTLPQDILKDMAERHIARAYLRTGDTVTASKIYAKHGDLISLEESGINSRETWDIVYETCPNSKFFKLKLQFLLTHLDNRYKERNSYDNQDIDESICSEKDNSLVEMPYEEFVLSFAEKVIREKKVDDLAMWYYAKAALENIIGKPQKALATVKEGEKYCAKGSFLEKSMRVLRIMIDAEISPYNSAYQTKLLKDLKWIDEIGRKEMSFYAREILCKDKARDKTTGKFIDFYGIEFENTYYWSDVMNRILIDVLATRLKADRNTIDALLYSNLGAYWIITNMYGKADSPNHFHDTDHNNDMASIAYSCKADDIAKMYEHIKNPTRGIDSLVVKYGKADLDYWRDMIGTMYIAEHNYEQAVIWLKELNKQYPSRLSTWEFYNRDPFCYKIGWKYDNRHHLESKTDYKLNFAIKMASLEKVIKESSFADIRGCAMIHYGVGLRNQKEYCWTLTRYSDTSDNYYATAEDTEKWGNFIDISDSESMISNGINTIENRNLKAHFLHVFARDKDVMDNYPDTETAENLRAHCDMWGDYWSLKSLYKRLFH